MLSIYEKLEIGLAGKLLHHEDLEEKIDSWDKAKQLARHLVETFEDLVPKNRGYETEEEYLALVFRYGSTRQNVPEKNLAVVEYLVACWLRKRQKGTRPTEEIDLNKLFDLAEKVVANLVYVSTL